MDSVHKQACVLLLLLQLLTTGVKTKEIKITDTWDATSDTGFVTGKDAGWTEVSESYDDGEDRRVLQICKLSDTKLNYWFRTFYLDVSAANILYIEVSFTIRACKGLKKKIVSCKETFNLYYLSSNSQDDILANHMNVTTYTKIETVAASFRFTGGDNKGENSDNKKVISLSLKNGTKGVYIAFQDTGACMNVMRVRIYRKVCEKEFRDLTVFPETSTGPGKTSLVKSAGKCVENAAILDTEMKEPNLQCNSEGQWLIPTGATCACKAGYMPAANRINCIACEPKFFKNEMGNDKCRSCPENSFSNKQGLAYCRCKTGYYRAPGDPVTAKCTQPPSEPNYVQSQVNKTVVTLSWKGPSSDGGRSDLTYSVKCFRCKTKHRSCTYNCDNVRYSPASSNLTEMKVKISKLQPHTYYKFQISSSNGVSTISRFPSSYAELEVKTNDAAPAKIARIEATLISSGEVLLRWVAPKSSAGPILDYEVVCERGSEKFRNTTKENRIQLRDLRSSTNYKVMVRARNDAGFGLFSEEHHFITNTLPQVTAFPVTSKRNNPGNTFDTSSKDQLTDSKDPLAQPKNERVMLVVAVICTLTVITVCILLIALNRKKKKYQRAKSGDSSVDHDIYPAFSDGSGASSRSYVDPSTYENPFLALQEFTKEIDMNYVSIERVIGGGEFGEVCQGSLLPIGKTVAIKQLKSGYSNREKENFLGEASIMGQFDHPHVIKLEGVVTRSRPHMIITEYMTNGSLDTFLRENPHSLSSLVITKMLYQVALGMKYLAEMGYVHRDLAARNILLDIRLSCKVSDFGLSRVLEDVSDDVAIYTTRGGLIPIRWTALEAITKRTFTSASDVWSYGIVMWEVLTFGERPYWELSNKDVIQLIETGYRLPPPRVCPKVLHTLMLDCWKHDRLDRPTFPELVNILGHFLSEPDVLGSCLNCRSPCEQEYCIPEVLDLTSLGQWLQQMRLLHFKPIMLQNGCVTAEQIIRLSSSELELMGITNPVDIQTILQGAVKLRHKICEVNHVGISV